MLEWLLVACFHFLITSDIRKSILSNSASFLGSTAEYSSVQHGHQQLYQYHLTQISGYLYHLAPVTAEYAALYQSFKATPSQPTPQQEQRKCFLASQGTIFLFTL